MHCGNMRMDRVMMFSWTPISDSRPSWHSNRPIEWLYAVRIVVHDLCEFYNLNATFWMVHHLQLELCSTTCANLVERSRGPHYANWFSIRVLGLSRQHSDALPCLLCRFSVSLLFSYHDSNLLVVAQPSFFWRHSEESLSLHNLQIGISNTVLRQPYSSIS